MKKLTSTRIKEIRLALGLTQQELAEKLLLSRNYVTLIEIGQKTPSIRVLSAAESLLADAHRESAKQESGGGGVVREESAPYGGLVRNLHPIPQTPSTESDCIRYFQQLVDAAKRSKDPDAFPVILHRLKKQFPLDEWAPKKEES